MKEREIAEAKAKAGKRPHSGSLSHSDGRHEAPPPASHPSLLSVHTRGGYAQQQQQRRLHEDQRHYSHHPHRAPHAFGYGYVPAYSGNKRMRKDDSMSDVDEDAHARWRPTLRPQGGSATGSGRSASASEDEDQDAEGDADDADMDAPESEEGVDDGGKDKRNSSWGGRKRAAGGDGEEEGGNQSADADADGDGELDADADGDEDVEASMDVVDMDADMDVDVVNVPPHASHSRYKAHNQGAPTQHTQADLRTAQHHRQEHEMRSRREEDGRMRSVMGRVYRSPMVGTSRQSMAIAGCLADLDSQYGRYVLKSPSS